MFSETKMYVKEKLLNYQGLQLSLSNQQASKTRSSESILSTYINRTDTVHTLL